MSPETVERIIAMAEQLKRFATKEELHKELHALSWRFFGLMVAQTILILGASYFLLSDIKSDIRDIRTRLTNIEQRMPK